MIDIDFQIGRTSVLRNQKSLRLKSYFSKTDLRLQVESGRRFLFYRLPHAYYLGNLMTKLSTPSMFDWSSKGIFD